MSLGLLQHHTSFQYGQRQDYNDAYVGLLLYKDVPLVIYNHKTLHNYTNMAYAMILVSNVNRIVTVPHLF